MRRSIVACLVIAALLVLAAPVVAGGWATVRLDEEPGDVLAGVPLKVGFVVRQHDATPTNDVEVVVRAVNAETGEKVTAPGVQEGPIGHFVAEMTLPQAGEWKWAVSPAPFAETSFPTLTVLDADGAALAEGTAPAQRAVLIEGSCVASDAAIIPLGDVAVDSDDPSVAAQFSTKNAAVPVALGSGKLDRPIADLLAGEIAVGVQRSAEDAELLACGHVVAAADDEVVEVGLQPWNGSGQVGVAVLRAHGDDTIVDLYLLTVGSASESLTTPLETATIEIASDASGDWVFQPAALEVAVGTEVTWRNDTDAVHTVTADDLSFSDSGILDPGQSFSQVFTEPGVYAFRCGPHPWMTGTIVVT